MTMGDSNRQETIADVVKLSGEDSSLDIKGEWSKARDTLEKAEESQQAGDADAGAQARGWIKPRYNPRELARLTEISEAHARCVSAKAQAVAGYGFDLVGSDTEDDPDDDELARANEFWNAGKFQLGPDKQPSTASSVLEHGWWDFEAIGWVALEVLVDNSATPVGLAHIPAQQIRRRKDAPGYIELDASGEIKTFFGSAGDRYYRDGDDTLRTDGTLVNVNDGSTNATGDAIANELLVIRNYSALSPYYGTPDIIPALQTLEADIAARSFNRRFFDNDGVPRFVVLVEGGQLTEKAWNALQEKLQELKLEENSHRGIILEAVAGADESVSDATNVKIRIEPLTVGIEEDASFQEFRQENRRDIFRAHEVPPVVGGDLDNANYSNSQSQREDFAHTTVAPKQERYAARLYQTLHVDSPLDCPNVIPEFALKNAENEERKAQVAKTKMEASAGSMLVNEAREQIDLGPLVDGDGNELPLGRVPLSDFNGGDSPGTPVVDEAAIEAMVDDAISKSEGEPSYSLVEADD